MINFLSFDVNLHDVPSLTHLYRLQLVIALCCPLQVIDGVVILISFALDIAVTDANFSHEVGKTVLIVFLIWRVIRILNGKCITG